MYDETAWKAPPSPEDVAARLRASVETAVPGLSVEETHHPECIRLEVPTAPESHYIFWAYIYRDGLEASIGAGLNDDPEAYFWGRSLEQWDFETPDALVEQLESILTAVASNPTRIRELGGVLTRSYVLEYKTSGGWRELPGNSALRFSNFRFVSLSGRDPVHSVPLSSQRRHNKR